jgi:hypothetical protein
MLVPMAAEHELLAGITALEAQRALLGDAVVRGGSGCLNTELASISGALRV